MWTQIKTLKTFVSLQSQENTEYKLPIRNSWMKSNNGRINNDCLSLLQIRRKISKSSGRVNAMMILLFSFGWALFVESQLVCCHQLEQQVIQSVTTTLVDNNSDSVSRSISGDGKKDEHHVNDLIYGKEAKRNKKNYTWKSLGANNEDHPTRE